MPTARTIEPSDCSSNGVKLLNLAKAVGGPLLMERSAKLIGGDLCQGRFLVSMPKAALYPGPIGQLRKICRELAIPDAAFAMLEGHVKAASNIHFGYEPEADGDLFKFYVEFSAGEAPKPELVFLAAKWQHFKDSYTVSQYYARHGNSPQAMETLVREILPTGPVQNLCEELLPRAGAILEVTEPGNPRRSLDFNLADAGLRLADLQMDLRPVFQVAGAEPALQDLLGRYRSAELGHLAAGTARNGKAFVTLYFGAERLQ